MKRYIKILLIPLILVAIFSVNVFAAPAKGFPDVKPEDWYYEDVMALQSSGIIDGFPDGTFRPQAQVTTGQALKMILLASGHPTPEPVSSHWARGYLNYAIEQGFLVRFQDITDLDVLISRQLVAKLAANALGLKRTSRQSYFTDTDSDYANALAEVDILRGYTDGSYRPENKLTRAELSAIVHRIYQYLQPPETPPEEKSEENTIELRTTDQGISFIKSLEGFAPYAFWDYAQYSIGYGTRCEEDEYPNGISKEEADQKLRVFLKQYEEKLDAFEEKNGLSFTSNEYDALISLCFNTGTSWMDNSRLSRLLIDGYDTNSFASAFGVWCHVSDKGRTMIHSVLVSRRIREIQMFLYGDYTGKASPQFCTVQFQTDCGSVRTDIAFFEKGSSFDVTYDASSADSQFIGWMAEDGSMITESSVIDRNMILSAVWEESEAEDPEDADDLPEDDWDDWDDWFNM